MPKIVAAHTQEGFVVRQIWPDRERAFRKNCDGGFSERIGHDGEWQSVNAALVPASVLHEVAKVCQPPQSDA